MSDCCNRASPPALLSIGPQFTVPSGFELHGSPKQSAQLLDETLHSVPPMASREARVLLTTLRNRQEQLFELVQCQQKSFQDQLAAIQSAIKDNSNAQDVVKRHQENLISEFRDFSSKSHSTDVVGKAVQTDVDAIIEDDVSNPSPTAKSEDAIPAPRRTVTFEGNMLLPESQGSAENSMPTVQYESQGSALRRSLNRMGTDKSGDVDFNPGFLDYIDRLLHSRNFEMTVAMAILINAFIMCWECQYQGLDVGFNLQYPGRPVEARFVWVGATTVFACFDWLFGCLFLIEMIVKIVCWRQYYFYKVPDETTLSRRAQASDSAETSSYMSVLLGVQVWNLLDGVSVAAFLFDKIADERFVNPQMLRLMRLFRLGRLVRLLRFLESLDHLYVMTTAISGLTQILAWAIVLLTLMLLTCDLFLVQILQVTYFDKVNASNLSEDELRKYHQVYEYFGTCTRCMLSMFEVTLGNWPPVARLLSEEVSEWFTLVCLVHKLTIGFAVVGVITGCILQETFKVAQTDDVIMFRQKKMAGRILSKKMGALFEALDASRDGKLQVQELKAIGAQPEIKLWLSSLNIETSDLNTLFDLIDVDGDGTITLDELVARMPRIQGFARSIDVLAMQKLLWKSYQHSTQSQQLQPGSQSCFADFILGS